MKTLKIALFSILLLFPISGCNYVHLGKGYEKKAAIEKKIEDLNIKSQEELRQKEAEIKTELNGVIAGQKRQMVSAVTTLTGTDPVRLKVDFSDRNWLIVFNRIDEAKTSLGQPPDQTQLLKEMERTLNELDATKTSLEQLKTEHKKKIEEGVKLAEETTKLKISVEQKEQEKNEMILSHNRDKENLQRSLNKVNDDLLIQQNMTIEQQAANTKLKRDLMYMFSGLGILMSLAGAYFKNRTLIIFGVLGVAMGVSIPFFEVKHIITFWITVISAGLFWVYKSLHTEKETQKGIADRALGTIQEVRNDSEETYQTIIKPKAEEWFRDAPELHDVVEKKLVDMNLKAIPEKLEGS